MHQTPGLGMPMVDMNAFTAPYNIEKLFAAAKALNDAADEARKAGWEVDLTSADYVSASATKVQKGNGPPP